MSAELITEAEAIAAIHRCAFNAGTPEEPDMIVHCFAGSFGADWSVDAAVKAVQNAYVHEGVPQIAWSDTLFGRCLYFIEADPPGKGGRPRTFDTVTPERVTT